MSASYNDHVHRRDDELKPPEVIRAEHIASQEPSMDQKDVSRLLLKMDLFLMPTVALLYLFCFIDRANIGNARLAGFEKDLGLRGYDYNTVLSVFYISYIIFEIPSNIVCKLLGPGWFIPAISLGFGLCSIGTAFVNNRAQVCAVRFLLGVFEAGVLPGIAYYLSRFYSRAELGFRLGLYIVMAPLAGAFGGLLASAILTLDNFGSLTAWRMIFAIEGIITIILSLLAFLTMTDRPQTARWLTDREKAYTEHKLRAERVGSSAVLDKMDKKKLFRGVSNPVTLGTAVIFMFDSVTVQGLGFFTPTIIRTIYPGRTIIQQQLLTVPPYIVGSFFVIVVTLLSWKLDRRLVLIILSTPLVIVGYIIFLSSYVPRIRYAAAFLVASTVFGIGPLCTAQASANVVSDTSRNSAIATAIMFSNMGGLVSTWSYLPHDAPHFRIGMGLNLATAAGMLVLGVVLLLWMRRDNRSREKCNSEEELAGVPEDQIQDMDWKHPDFRWHP
ncbi:major facilitator superfamily domain-containing protein [Boeremia exigua]|uniref:major facilitator superfamily domain-containing protein n=1 Tax=Boeremia exigua TaxID=749465 RepID=UPI001E8CBB28|nr:major facilitator superfamily domain-containing protein [Boeremia exigua]KAH6618826.1 major facilitator superfamily domain-containing protein [Boeremia exigua]